MDLPLLEIGLVGLVASMIYGNSKDNWNIFRHDLSVLGARREREGLKGTRFRRSEQPELFNVSIGIIGISFFQIGTLLYHFVAFILLAMAIVDVATHQTLHVMFTSMMGVVMIGITIDQLVHGRWFFPVIILGSTVIYLMRFLPRNLAESINTSVFQKVSIGTFLVSNLRLYA